VSDIYQGVVLIALLGLMMVAVNGNSKERWLVTVAAFVVGFLICLPFVLESIGSMWVFFLSLMVIGSVAAMIPLFMPGDNDTQ